MAPTNSSSPSLSPNILARAEHNDEGAAMPGSELWLVPIIFIVFAVGGLMDIYHLRERTSKWFMKKYSQRMIAREAARERDDPRDPCRESLRDFPIDEKKVGI